jgi:hypothetical protein
MYVSCLCTFPVSMCGNHHSESSASQSQARNQSMLSNGWVLACDWLALDSLLWFSQIVRLCILSHRKATVMFCFKGPIATSFGFRLKKSKSTLSVLYTWCGTSQEVSTSTSYIRVIPAPCEGRCFLCGDRSSARNSATTSSHSDNESVTQTWTVSLADFFFSRSTSSADIFYPLVNLFLSLIFSLYSLIMSNKYWSRYI